jgi:hypothetical protein
MLQETQHTLEANLQKLYKENEENNRHTNNYSLLAKAFGKGWQKDLANAAIKFQFENSYSDSHLSEACYQLIHKPLISKLFPQD